MDVSRSLILKSWIMGAVLWGAVACSGNSDGQGQMGVLPGGQTGQQPDNAQTPNAGGTAGNGATPAGESPPSTGDETPTTPGEEPATPGEEPATPNEDPGAQDEDPATPNEDPAMPGNDPTADFEAGCNSTPGSPAIGPCSSYITPNDIEVELGPYGAIMDSNVGAGFETGATDDSALCTVFAASFGEDPERTEQLLDIGDLDLNLHTVYRPGYWAEGETYPVITWGNGTCAQPEGYGTLLRYVASHGYVVVAPNNRQVGSGTPQRRGLDFLEAANDDPESPYYQKLDFSRVGAMGHSQGGGGTVAAAGDSRVQAVILWNGGSSASKPFMAVSGDMDIGGMSPTSMSSAVNRADKAAFLFYHMIPATGSLSGHLTLMLQPERVVGPAVAWWDLVLKEDQAAREWFVGDSCMLCGRDAEFEFGQKGL